MVISRSLESRFSASKPTSTKYFAEEGSENPWPDMMS